MGPSNWMILAATGLSLVGILLFVLRLAGMISLSWWWIALPMLPMIALCVLIVWFIASWMASGSH